MRAAGPLYGVVGWIGDLPRQAMRIVPVSRRHVRASVLPIPLLNAVEAALEVSIGQSSRRLPFYPHLSHQSRPWIWRKRVPSDLNMPRIHCALLPPRSVEAISPISIGLLGAMRTIWW